MMGTTASGTKYSWLRTGVATLIVLCLLLWFSSRWYHSTEISLTSTLNSTLGFGATILISLPERTDRRDAISLISSTSDVTISHTISAVRGEDIASKARPYVETVGKLDSPHWGSWRSHLDALKYVVDNRIETALIIEDDIDWSMSIKSQMHSFAQALQSSPLRESQDPKYSRYYPYGTDWDVMHLGISNITMPPAPYHKSFTAYHDPTLRAGVYRDAHCQKKKTWYCFAPSLKALKTPQQSRAIIPSHGPIGLVAIAVTFRGAQRLLYLLSWQGKGLGDGLDCAIRDYMREGDLKGWTVIPPLFGSWTTDAGDSDIRVGATDSPANNMKGSPRGVEDSVRQHLGEVIAKEKGWQVLTGSRGKPAGRI